MYLYQKTLLYSVKNLNTAIRDCQKMVEYLSLSSKYSQDTCDKIATQILVVVERKQKLIILKEILKKIVGNFTCDEKKLFAKKYLGKNYTFNNYSARQYYRNQNKLLKNFSHTLKIFGLDEQRFNKEYLTIPYLNSVYSMVKEKEKD